MTTFLIDPQKTGGNQDSDECNELPQEPPVEWQQPQHGVQHSLSFQPTQKFAISLLFEHSPVYCRSKRTNIKNGLWDNLCWRFLCSETSSTNYSVVVYLKKTQCSGVTADQKYNLLKQCPKLLTQKVLIFVLFSVINIKLDPVQKVLLECVHFVKLWIITWFK